MSLPTVNDPPRRGSCTLCGRELGGGAPCWVINGALICEDCLPEYARWDYAACRAVWGEEDAP